MNESRLRQANQLREKLLKAQYKAEQEAEELLKQGVSVNPTSQDPVLAKAKKSVERVEQAILEAQRAASDMGMSVSMANEGYIKFVSEWLKAKKIPVPDAYVPAAEFPSHIKAMQVDNGWGKPMGPRTWTPPMGVNTGPTPDDLNALKQAVKIYDGGSVHASLWAQPKPQLNIPKQLVKDHKPKVKKPRVKKPAPAPDVLFSPFDRGLEDRE